MEYKGIDFEIKAVEEESGQISAYASTFGNRDLVNDIVLKGCFEKSLASGRVPKLLWNHDKDQPPVGIFDEVYEDDYGLFVKFRMANTPRGSELTELMKLKAITSLSIGYQAIDFDVTTERVRLLKECLLWEISLVSFPANELAVVTSSIKSNTEFEAISALLHNRIALLKA